MNKLIKLARKNRYDAVSVQSFYRAVFWREMETLLNEINQLDQSNAQKDFRAVTQELDAFVAEMKHADEAKRLVRDNER